MFAGSLSGSGIDGSPIAGSLSGAGIDGSPMPDPLSGTGSVAGYIDRLSVLAYPNLLAGA